MSTHSNMNVIKYKNIFLSVGGVIIAASIVCIAYFGLSFGIDFTGGSILEVTFNDERPSIEATEDAIAAAGVTDYSVRTTGDNGFIVRSPFLEDQQRSQVMDNFEALTGSDSSEASSTATTSDQVVTDEMATTSTTTAAGVIENRFSSIGPTVGSELTRSAIYGIIAVVLGIILFVTFAFRKVSEIVSSWVYGSVAIVALIHDILVPTAIFAILGVTMGAQIDLLFVMALLAILGFSVNDTIVVFDRIRENLQTVIDKNTDDGFADTVGISLTQTYARSINTSLTTLTVLACLYFIGGQSTELFSLTLLVGVIAGTYSSIFIASPLLVKVHEWQQKGE